MAVKASAEQQALAGLGSVVPLFLIPRDEQVVSTESSNILGPVRILITVIADKWPGYH